MGLQKGGEPVADEIISRDTIADSYISGTGIEIGALHNPLSVPNGVSVKQKQVIGLMEKGYSIHYHVFAPDSMMEFFSKIKNILNYQFKYEIFFRNETEVITVLRRT